MDGLVRPPSVPPVDGHAPPAGAEVARNLNGQKLGRKGRDTRRRILEAAAQLLAEGGNEPISLSAIARRCSLGMTSLYLYFNDLTELLLALLQPVVDQAGQEFSELLSGSWDDERLAEHCRAFLDAYYQFWSRNAHLLHLRNSMADSGDERMTKARVRSSQPLIGFFARQMGGCPDDKNSYSYAMATVLTTGMERTVTVATDSRLTGLFGPDSGHAAEHYLEPEARLMELAIRDTRARARLS
ncbi:MAG: TetR/AcrR family transcriptional regulator [Novosphingobium sp.]